MSGRRSGESRTAAASTAPVRRKAQRSYQTPHATAEGMRNGQLNFDNVISELCVYDTYGPGFVGAYNDNVADDVAELIPIIEFRAAHQPEWMPLVADYESWAPTVIEVAQEVLSEWGSSDTASRQLRWTHTRLLCARGAAWIYDDARMVAGMPHGFRVISPAQVEVKDNRWMWTHPDTGATIEVKMPDATGALWRSWTPHPDDPLAPYPEWVRAVPHIREFVAAKVRQRSDADTSHIPDVLWLGEGEDARPLRRGETADVDHDFYDADDGIPDLARDFANVLTAVGSRRYHQRGENLPPMPLEGETEPKLVSLLRELDAGSFTLEDKSIENAARSLRIPTKLMVEGPGNAKYDNEALLYLAWLNSAVAPKAAVVYEDWSRMWFWPTVAKRFAGRIADGVLPKGFQVRLWFNTDQLMPRQDNFANLVNAVKLGGAPASILADKLKVDHLELPEGMTPFQLYETYIGNTNAQQQHRTAAINVPSTPQLEARPEPDRIREAELRVYTMVQTSMTMMLTAAQRECERRLTRALNSGPGGSNSPRAKNMRAQIKELPDVYAKWNGLSAEQRTSVGLAAEALVYGSTEAAGRDMAALLSGPCVHFNLDIDAAVRRARSLIEWTIDRRLADGAERGVTDEMTMAVMTSLRGDAPTELQGVPR